MNSAKRRGLGSPREEEIRMNVQKSAFGAAVSIAASLVSQNGTASGDFPEHLDPAQLAHRHAAASFACKTLD
jgi:hypothetical protein